MVTRIPFSVDHAWGSWKIDVHGGFSQTLFGEIGLSELQIVFAEVSICPETMKLLQKSSRETDFEATATCFEFPWRIGRKSEMKQVGIPWGGPGRQGRSPGFTKLSQDRTETRIKLKVARGQVARYEPGCAGQGWDRLGRAGIGRAGEGAI